MKYLKLNSTEAEILHTYYSKILIGKIVFVKCLRHGKYKISSVIKRMIDGKYEFGVTLTSTPFLNIHLYNCYDKEVWNDIEKSLTIPSVDIILNL